MHSIIQFLLGIIVKIELVYLINGIHNAPLTEVKSDLKFMPSLKDKSEFFDDINSELFTYMYVTELVWLAHHT